MSRTNDELTMRIAVCEFCIKTLEKYPDDPRQPAALENYKAQLAKLKAELASQPDIVIGLKPAILFGKVPKIGG